jgi:hypothetical protein
MNNKFILLFVTSQFIFNISFAQKNFKPGFIIDNQGRKIEGFIDYQNWNKNPQRFTFKTNLAAPESIYSLQGQNLIECHINIEKGEEIYLRRVTMFNKSWQGISDLSDSIEPKMAIDSGFVRVLEKGNLTLLYLKEDLDQEHFFIESPGVPVFELIHKKYIYINPNSPTNGYKTNEKYRQQLSRLMFNNKDLITDDIQKMNFNEQDLRALIKKFNMSQSSNIEYTFIEDKTRNEYGLLGGLSLNSGTLSYQIFSKSNDPLAGNSSPILGIFVNFDIYRTNHNWYIYNELNYSSFQITGSTGYLNALGNNLNYNTTASLEYSYLSMTNAVEYKYHLGTNAEVNFKVGFSNGLLITGSNELRYNNILGQKLTEKLFEEVKTFQQGLLMGIGGWINHFGLGIRYSIGNGMSPYSYKYVTTSTIIFSLGYKF